LLLRLLMQAACAVEGRSYHRHEPEKTVLSQAVAGHLETFLDECRRDDHSLACHVEGELRRFLDCGILSRGFCRLVCDQCGAERVVAFSCKGRSFCPSCTQPAA